MAVAISFQAGRPVRADRTWAGYTVRILFRR